MKYFIAISILLSNFSDSIISNTEFFKLSTPQCLSAISVFDTKPSSSVLQCASSCLDNLVGMCGMFIWNSEKNECLLHSDSTFFGNVSIETGFLIYSRMYSGMYSYIVLQQFRIVDLSLWCLTPHSTIFQLYHDSFIDEGSRRKPPNWHVTGKLYHINVVSSTPCHQRDSSSQL